MNCPLCAAPGATTYLEEPTFSVLECAACGFRYVDTAAPNYPREAQYVHEEPQIGSIRPHLPHIQRRAADVLRFRRPPGRALDIGCGRGELALALAQQGFSVTGVDMKERLVSHLRERLPQVEWSTQSLRDLAAAGRRFEVATMYHVLEHIPDPRGALATVKSLVVPGGLIAIEVPNVGGLEARLKGRKWHYYKVDHVSYFRTGDLLRLAGDLGLRVLATRGYQHFSHPQGSRWKDAAKSALAVVGFKDVTSVFLAVP